MNPSLAANAKTVMYGSHRYKTAALACVGRVLDVNRTGNGTGTMKGAMND